MHPDSTGFFFLELDPGTYDVIVTLEGYQIPIIECIEIYSGETTTLDITLNFMFPPQNLTYIISGDHVILDWDPPNTMRILLGYKVYRDGTQIAYIDDPTITTYSDLIQVTGTQYFVTALYTEGESGPSNTVTIVIVDISDPNVPMKTELTGNYPNPFNPETKISFSLKEGGNVSLQIYNIKGEKVKILINEHLDAAYYNIIWNGKNDYNQNIALGVYFYKLQTSDYSKIRKMILIK